MTLVEMGKSMKDFLRIRFNVANAIDRAIPISEEPTMIYVHMFELAASDTLKAITECLIEDVFTEIMDEVFIDPALIEKYR